MKTFNPIYQISNLTAKALVRIEAVRQRIELLPIHPTILSSLRETARLFATHYSTMIEGNRLTQVQVGRVIANEQHFPGRKRDEIEVKGYYAALSELEALVARKGKITELFVQTLYGLVMGGGKKRVKPSPYRDGQNVICDSSTGRIVYMPPEAKDVPRLMKQLIAWLKSSESADVPCAIRAAIAHYQFATIHPYYDGNGRTARLIANLMLHLGGYDLKGIYCLEEYYAKNLQAYYDNIAVGPSHNYYLGRASADISKWIEYFCLGMAESFEAVAATANEAAKKGVDDKSEALRALDAMQRKCLELFQQSDEITSGDIQEFFGYKPRSATALLSRWVDAGFLVITNTGRRTRRYGLAKKYRHLVV